jgi:hypothetical protein
MLTAQTVELTRNPAMIRSQLIGVAENLDWELFCRELMSYLPSATLRDFTEHLREQADIDDLLMFE